MGDRYYTIHHFCDDLSLCQRGHWFSRDGKSEAGSVAERERMPVLLTSEVEWKTWMHGTPTKAFAQCVSHPVDQMRIAGSGLKRKDLQLDADQSSGRLE